MTRYHVWLVRVPGTVLSTATSSAPLWELVHCHCHLISEHVPIQTYRLRSCCLNLLSITLQYKAAFEHYPSLNQSRPTISTSDPSCHRSAATISMTAEPSGT